MGYLADVNYWRVDELFMNILPQAIHIDDHQRQSLKTLFLADMSVEFDAKNLYDFLHVNHLVSEELEAFLKPWLYEELKHADAFRRILSLTHALDEVELLAGLHQRTADFSAFENLLEDEFKFCVLMAYDECSTTIAYRKDTFYKKLGPIEFVKWHKLVIEDEARHLKNAVRLIHYKPANRLKETNKVLEEIIAMEQIAPPYNGTFVFDRDDDSPNNQPTFEELKIGCVSRVQRLILAA